MCVMSSHSNGFLVTSNELHLLQQISRSCNHHQRTSIIVNVDAICRDYVRWALHLPRVRLFFPVRFNNDPVLISMVAKLGAGFSCVSKREIQEIMKLGVSPQRILYNNSCKQRSHLQYAHNAHVNLTTFCELTELEKIRSSAPDSRLLLKIGHPSSGAFDVDYGIDISEALPLIKRAKQMDLSVVGVCLSSDESLRTNLDKVKQLFADAKSVGLNMCVLELDHFPNSGASREISKLLDIVFPQCDYPELKIIAEADRLYANSAFTVCTSVILGSRMYKGEKAVTVDSELFATVDKSDLPVPIAVRLRPDGQWAPISGNSSDCPCLVVGGGGGDKESSVYSDSLCVTDEIRTGDMIIWPEFSCSWRNDGHVARTYFCSVDLWTVLNDKDGNKLRKLKDNGSLPHPCGSDDQPVGSAADKFDLIVSRQKNLVIDS